MLTAFGPWIVRLPSQSVNRPPASSRIGRNGDESQAFISGSRSISARPVQTSACPKASPQVRRASTRSPSASQIGPTVAGSVVVASASSSRSTRDTRAGRPFHQAPSPTAPVTISESPARLQTPTTGSPPISSPISVPKSGTPWTKLVVPSIGSRIQRCVGSEPDSPSSSPSTRCFGKRASIRERSSRSAAISASVTGVRSGFIVTPTPTWKWRVMSRPASQAISVAKSSSSRLLAGILLVPFRAASPGAPGADYATSTGVPAPAGRGFGRPEGGSAARSREDGRPPFPDDAPGRPAG